MSGDDGGRRTSARTMPRQAAGGGRGGRGCGTGRGGSRLRGRGRADRRRRNAVDRVGGKSRSAGPPPRKRPRDARGGHCLRGRGRAADGGRADSGRGCRCGRPARARGVRGPSLQAKPRDTRGPGQRTRSRDGRGGRCPCQRYHADIVVRCRCGRGRGRGGRRLPPRKRLQDARKGRFLRRCGPARGGRGRAGEATVDEATGRPPRSSPPRPRTCRAAAGDVAADVPRRSGARGHRRGRQQVTIAAEGGSAGTSLPQMRQWGRRWGEMPSVVAPARRPTAANKAAGRPR